MRAQCIEAVTKAAEAMGRKIKKSDLVNIETNIQNAMRQLAQKDPASWIKKSKEDRVTEASKYVTDQLIHESLKKKQRAELQLVKDGERMTVLANMKARGLTGAEALERFMFFNADSKGKLVSIESTAKQYAARWSSELSELWGMEHENLYSYLVTNKKAQADFVKEVFGKDSGNPQAKAAAAQYKAMTEKIIKDMNNAGFDIKNLADYHMPQATSWWKIFKEVGAKGENKAAVVNDFLAHIDRKKYLNADGTRYTDEQMREFLNQAVTTLYSDGYNKIEGKGSGSMANRHTQHRELHWKDADSYSYIMEKYSETNPIDAIWSQMARMGKELAIVEKFGPNARDGFRTEITKLAEAGENASKLNFLESAFDDFVGVRQAIQHPRLHRFAQNVRSAMSAALLGSNTITQITDQATLGMTAHAMNVPALSAFKEQAKQLTSAQDREIARSLALALETTSNHIARVTDGMDGLWGKAANAVLTINLSNKLTRATRAGFGVAMLKHMGSLASRYETMEGLHADDLKVMQSKGVTNENWALWRKASPTDGEPLHFQDIAKLSDEEVLALAPDRVKKVNESGIKDVASQLSKEADAARQSAINQLMGMTLEETHMASLQPSFLATRPLSNTGEIGKLLFQFKQFPIAFFMQHIMQRSLMKGDGIANRAAYIVPLLTATTVMGGIANWLNDIASGRDPRELTGKAVMQGFFKGGGLGPLGDLINPEQSLGVDPAAKLFGPAVGHVVNVQQLTGHLYRAGVGEGDREKELTKAGAEVYQIGRGFLPGQNLWWGKAVLNQLMMNDISEFLSPGYKERLKQNAEKNYSAGYWMSDDGVRTPNFGNIAGGQ